MKTKYLLPFVLIGITVTGALGTTVIAPTFEQLVD